MFEILEKNLSLQILSLIDDVLRKAKSARTDTDKLEAGSYSGLVSLFAVAPENRSKELLRLIKNWS